MTTRQSVELKTKEGKQFLRKVIKDNVKSYGDGWHIRATRENGWKVEFNRTIKGQLGEPDQDIVVTTDETIGVRGRFGAVKSFEDSDEVTVLEPRRVFLNGETPHACKLLLDGYRLEVVGSSGSTSSSKHGLTFYYLQAMNQEYGYSGLTIGGETVAVHGRIVTRSAVDVD